MKNVSFLNWIFTITLVLTSIVLISNTANAQTEEENKEITLKIMKEVDGEMTMTDTTFVLKEGENVNDILKSMGIDCEINNTICCDKKGKSTNKEMKCMKLVTTAEFDGEEGDVKIDVTTNEDGTMTTIMTHADGTVETKTIEIPASGTTHVEESEHGQIIIKMIDNDGENIDLNIISEISEMKMVKMIVDENGETQIITDGEEGEVSVFVVKDGDQINCTATCEVIIIDIKDDNLEKLEKTGIKTENNKKVKQLEAEDLNFYPNPNNGLFRLNFTLAEKGKTTIKIYNMNGAEVYSETLRNFSGNYNKEIDLTKQNAGTYFLQIIQNKKIISKEILKSN